MRSPEGYVPSSDPVTGEHSAFRTTPLPEAEPAQPWQPSAPEATAPRERWSFKKAGNYLFNIAMRAMYGDLKPVVDELLQGNGRHVGAPEVHPGQHLGVIENPQPPSQSSEQQHHVPHQRRPVDNSHTLGLIH